MAIISQSKNKLSFNVFMHNVVKLPNILCGVHNARVLKYVWPFSNIMHERVKIYFPNYVKFFVIFWWIFNFVAQIRKIVLQKEIRDWVFKVCLLAGELTSWFPFYGIIKNDLRQVLCVVLKFSYQTNRVYKNTCGLPKISKNEQVGWPALTCPKLAKWLSILNRSE